MASEIKDLRMSRMTIGACADFHRNVKELVVEYTPAVLHVEEEFEVHGAALDRLVSVVNRQRKLVATPFLREKDKLRDRAIGVINSVIPCYETSPSEAKRNAALRMLAKLSGYKGIQRHEYRKQNMEVEGMLAVLTDPDNAADIELLGLVEERDILVTANADFMKAYREKTDELGAMGSVKDTDSKEAMEAVNAAYEQIRKKVNAYALLHPTEEINTFIQRLNGVVEGFSDLGGVSGGGSVDDGSSDGDSSDGSDSGDSSDGDSSDGGDTGGGLVG